MRKPKDWGQPCPNSDCSHYRLINRGNMSAISTYLTQSGKRRIFRCGKCEGTFSETRDTVFFALRTPEEKVMMALKMLLVKVALSDIGFVLGVTEETVLAWLGSAAKKAHEINTHLLRDLPVTEALPVNHHTSVKLYGSTGVSTRTESDFDAVGILLQYRWGGGL